MNAQRRGISTLFCSAIALSAVACAAPVQQVAKVVSAPVKSAPPKSTLSAPALLTPPRAVALPSAAAHVAVQPQVEPRADAVAAGVAELYQQVNTWRASFKQRYSNSIPSSLKDSTGVVSFAKPDKMSWRYDNGNRVVGDSVHVEVFEKEARVVFEGPAGTSQYPVALSFLSAPADVRRSFGLTLLEPERTKYAGGHVLAAEPLQPSAAFQRVLFYVDGRSSKVLRALIVDAQGNRNRFDFKVFATNPYIPADEFFFTPPPGTRIVSTRGR